MVADHTFFVNLIWQIADLLRGPYLPPQYKRVMLPMTVLRRFDCVLAPTKDKVVAKYEQAKGGKLAGDALDTTLNKVAEQRSIVAHITRETAKIDAVRTATERTIALLKERRSALIAAAVTGQLDVGTA